MPAAKEDTTASGFEKFTKIFLPYILIAFGLIQYIYTREMTSNQSVFVEIRDEQKKGNAKMAEVLTLVTVHDGRIGRVEKDVDEIKADNLELHKQLSELEKSYLLSNGNRR